LGPEFVKWSDRNSDGRLRWWQRLAAARILEVDEEGRLCWETAILSMPRQLGKSWLVRELALWRMHQAELFGERQNVMHIGNDLAVCMEVQQPARAWAQQRDGYQVYEANGKERIVRLECGSRWLVKSKDKPYGFAVTLALVDEAWDVKLAKIEEGLEPTMAEREQPQILFVSTAHRLTTSLMLSRRRVALSELEDGAGLLLLEWSAPRGSRLDDRQAWRQASAHWSPRRQEVLERRLAAALDNTIEDSTEPDPIASFRAQWLNEWPPKLADPTGNTEELLPPGLWADRADPEVESVGPIWVAVEDAEGYGAAVAVAGRVADGRLELDGWLCRDWRSAVEDVQQLGRPIRELLVGASMLNEFPADTVPRARAAVSTQTRTGLALLRDLVATAQIVHDPNKPTNDIDETFAATEVRTTMAGLIVTASPATHLVKAAVWALQAAHRPAPVPSIF
jgi:hypothetical protein